MPKPASALLVLVCLGWTMTAAAGTVDIRVGSSSRDADETNTGTVTLTATSLNLGAMQWIGLRFSGVTIPQGAYITSAYVTFTARYSNAGSTSLTIFGENADSSGAFTATANNISSRARTTASVAWASMPSWTAGNTYSTPELKTVVQEIVNRSNWASGNNLSILARSDNLSGSRRAESYDHSTTLCPLLHVDYVVVTRPVAKRLLFVVTSTTSPTTQETQRKTFFEAIGYTVTLIAATASQASFDTAAAANDVAYICEAITSTDLNTKLKSKPLGIVNEEPALSDDFSISSTYSSPSASAVTITKNNHYITSVFSTGSLTFTTSAQAMNTWTGTLAPELNTLATIGGVPSLAVMEINGKLYDGTRSAGRRVFLPWSWTAIDLNTLTDDGYVLLSRALAWAGGVVGYWKFDETTSATAYDSSVNLHNGTLTNCSFGANRVATAKVGGGLSFDGTSAYVSAPSTTDLQLTQAVSMSAWIKGNSWGSGDFANIILRKGDANANNYQFQIENGYVALGLDGSDSANPHGNTLLQAGTWYHVAATWDGSTVKIYVNGVLDNTPTSHAAPIGTDTRALYLGGRINNTDFFSGVLDDVRLYNHALDVDEINVLKTQGQLRGVRITKWVEVQ